MKKKTISVLLGVVMLLSGISVSYAVDMTDAVDIAGLPQQEQGTEPGNPPIDISGDIVIPSSDTQLQEADGTGSTDTGGDVENSEGSGEGEDLSGEDSHLTISFDDVQNPSEYFYNPVYWAVKKGITQGTSDTEFSPNAICTRAQIVTFLWRKAGKPEPETASNPFKDVAETDYFYKAVLWAVEAKITSGTAEDRFGPDDQCTRAQCVTFLWRNYGSPAPEIGGVFNDVDSSAYYCQAVNWALEKGVTNGMSSVQFLPDTSCTRGQTVTLFYRASLENVDRQNVEGDVVTGAFIDADVNGKEGSFILRADNVSAESGIQSVRTAVWTKADRSDLHWYDMQGTDRSGSYQLPLSVRDYNTTFGVYHAKLYAVTALEQQVELDQRDTDVKADGYMFTEALGNRQIRVTVMGVPDGNEVSFASWSDENYLDDLFWTSGQNQGNGTWTAVLDTVNFASAGACNTDVYLNGNAVYNTTTYSVQLWETMPPIEWEIYGYTQQVYNQVGTDLYALFRYCAGIPYYRPTPTPESGYTNSQWYALYGFKNHKGHCYVHAATFYWLAKNLGYEVYYVQGYVPRRGGGVTTHGWTELIINGTKYVVDPNFTNETGRNGYMITYGASGTWRYQNYQRMP